MQVGDQVNFFTKHTQLWHGRGGPMPAEVLEIGSETLELRVQAASGSVRTVIDVPEKSDDPAQVFWWESV